MELIQSSYLIMDFLSVSYHLKLYENDEAFTIVYFQCLR